jgi:hypothetical protein
MEAYTLALLTLAACTVLICTASNARLGWAALGVGGGFGLIIFCQLALGWSQPLLALLTASVDLLAVLWIGRAVPGRAWPSGVHAAGLAICISLVSHPLYYAMGSSEHVTFIYYLTANICMAVACLGLIGSGLADWVARHGGAVAFGAGGASGSSGLASRREASRWTPR